MTRSASHAVLRLELGRHVVPITWDRVKLDEPEPEPDVYGLKSRTFTGKLAYFDFLDTQGPKIRAELYVGEVLEEDTSLTNTNCWSLALQSTDAWTGPAGWYVVAR